MLTVELPSRCFLSGVQITGSRKFDSLALEERHPEHQIMGNVIRLAPDRDKAPDAYILGDQSEDGTASEVEYYGRFSAVCFI